MGKIYFIGELTLDEISYLDGRHFKNVMGGGVLYSAIGAAIWKYGDICIITDIGRGYSFRKLFKLCSKFNIKLYITHRRKIPCIKLSIPYDERGEHKFIIKKGSGGYEEFCPDPNVIEKIHLEDSIHIATMPLFRQLQYILNIKGAKYITLDPNIDDIKVEYLEVWKLVFSRIDYFLISKIELDKFLSILFPESRPSEELILKFIKQYKIKNLVLKKGKDGAQLYSNEKCLVSVTSIVDNPIDVTGAGDAFAGGFLYALNRFKDQKTVMKYASISSAQIINNIGVEGIEMINENNIKFYKDFLYA